MTIASGTYELGPADGTVAVRTGRKGAVAVAGHDLLLHANAWHATLEVAGGEPAAVSLEVDTTSFEVIEGTGGMQPLDDGDRAGIVQTIDDEILGRAPVSFRSSRIEAGGGAYTVHGELTLAGATAPLAVELTLDGTTLRARTVVVQTAWGLKPYTTLFGALRVADEVEVEIDASLPALRPSADGGAPGAGR